MLGRRHLVNLSLLLLAIFGRVASTSQADWWEGASFYQIYPRSFQDSNGDGIGDLNGITSRLEYLKEIGITAAWLSPIFESPMSDNGYDISNFTRPDPLFGTLEDFDAMMAKAKRLGVKILLDFVPNHSSDECEWFKKSVRREDGYDDFYVWDDGLVDPNNASNRLPPSNWVSIFGGPQWTWNDERQQFFLHQFQVKQPDLNFRNPKARQHMLEVLEYWLDRGVDGFRIDAVPHIFEKRFENGTYPDEPVSGWSSNPNTYDYHDHIYTKDQYETVEVIYEWREFLDEYKRKNGGDTRVILAEAYSPIETLSLYIGNGTHAGAQVPMNFNLMYLNGYSTARDVDNSVRQWMDNIWPTHSTANWVIGNHDNSRVAERLGRHKVDLMNIIVNCLPGASVTYYGEEIGMTDVPCRSESCDGRDPERTPMQWSPGLHAGFSEGPSTWLPVAEDYERYNVQTERGVSLSSLRIFKGLQELKKSKPFRAFKQANAFQYGALNDQVFQIVRIDPSSQEEYRILVNLGDQLETLEGVGSKVMQVSLVNLYSSRKISDKIDLSHKFHVMPFEAIVLHWQP